MKRYADMASAELKELHDKLQQEYDQFAAKGLDLNMARGKPGSEQLALSMPMLDILTSSSDCTAEDGTDCRNYGVLAGLPEARRLMAEMLGCKPNQVIVCGNASLNIEYDLVARFELEGAAGQTPWCKLDTVKFLCPAPGYDRHFRICEHFGIEMIPVQMGEDGPDMDAIEKLVADDPAIKGIWCVPQYSNPTGATYSRETVQRLAALKTAAPDFRIFWDNAYCVHDIYPDDEARRDRVDNIIDACEQAGNPDRVFEFCSTSKITFPGAGISAVAASESNISWLLESMGPQTIGYDKLNQLRHVEFLRDAAGIQEHMAKHAQFLRPRFEAVLTRLENDLGDTGIATWTRPHGGYFISFEGPEGTAKEIVARAAQAGVKLTGAGATWPYGKDPHDSNIRIAPSYPSLEDLELAAQLFTICVRLVAIEKLLA